MTDLLTHVEASIRSRKLLTRGASVLVAVSGGVDSMVLLHVLHALTAKNGWKISVAHFNHQLRGRSSDADERFVRKTATALGLKYFWGLGAVRTIAKARGESIEMTARTLRHDFLASIARQIKCRIIVLAHHADDQVELFFLRLLRGASGEGLAGMKWINASPSNESIRLIRPLLDLAKADLVQFARQRKISFREDASNLSLDIRRNRIRHKLLPLLRRQFQPALDRTILRVMELIGAEAKFAIQAAQTWQSKRASFSTVAVALQRRILQRQLLEHGIAADFDLVESLRMDANKPKTVGSNRFALRDARGRVTVGVGDVLSDTFNRDECQVHLKGRAGQVRLGDLCIDWRISAQSGARLSKLRKDFETFDADKIGAQIVLRYWRPGDRFQPIGMAKSVKLQDWFVNRKIRRPQRHGLVVAVTSDGEIFWIEGQRISEKFKLTPATRRRFIWRWRRG